MKSKGVDTVSAYSSLLIQPDGPYITRSAAF